MSEQDSKTLGSFLSTCLMLIFNLHTKCLTGTLEMLKRTQYVFLSEPGSCRKVSVLTKGKFNNAQRTRTWQINDDVYEM